MNSEDFIFLLKHPKKIDAQKTQQLDEIIKEFPYFQSAHAIQLKGLNKTNSFKYNQALKKTAAYTIDRKVLFEFITSQNFSINLNSRIEILEEIEVIEPETVKALHKKIVQLFSPKKTENNLTKEEFRDVQFIKKEPEISAEIQNKENAAELLEIGKPLEFSSTEPHSFNEWMQLISKKPIKREKETVGIEEISIQKDDKFSLIDKFLESNPKIKPVDKQALNIDISMESSNQNESLMTETLAKVYLEQKKYLEAFNSFNESLITIRQENLKTSELQEAITKTLKQLHGSFALGIIFKDKPDFIIGARRGSPLAVGYGPNENYLGSDSYTLKSMTNKITYLDDGEFCFVKKAEVDFFNEDGSFNIY